jgi:hypothetical protein
MTVSTIRLTGQSLIDFVNEKMPTIDKCYTRTDMVRDAGYINANGTGAYVDFYTELLKAKGMDQPGYVADRDVEDAEYDALSGTEQEMYDAIHDKFGSKWDHEQIMDFMSELDDYGIDTPERLDDAYEWETDEYRAEEKFAQYFIEELYCESYPSILEGCIDWETLWRSTLSYDYSTIEFDGTTFFFRSNF